MIVPWRLIIHISQNRRMILLLILLKVNGGMTRSDRRWWNSFKRFWNRKAVLTCSVFLLILVCVGAVSHSTKTNLKAFGVICSPKTSGRYADHDSRFTGDANGSAYRLYPSARSSFITHRLKVKCNWLSNATRQYLVWLLSANIVTATGVFEALVAYVFSHFRMITSKNGGKSDLLWCVSWTCFLMFQGSPMTFFPQYGHSWKSCITNFLPPITAECIWFCEKTWLDVELHHYSC